MSQLKHKVSFQTENYLRSTLYIRERVATMTRVTRPICLIGHILKIFEKKIKLQVMGYLEVNNHITSYQSDYRNEHNTQTALHRVVDGWLYNISDGNLAGLCCFDLKKKCLDTMHHAAILKKMYFYGFKYHASKWFKSHLYNINTRGIDLVKTSGLMNVSQRREIIS